MIVKQAPRIVLLWAVLSAVLLQLLYASSESSLRTALAQQLRQHLFLTVGEGYFNSSGDTANDATALQRIGANLNQALAGVVQPRWYSAYGQCSVRVLAIDGVAIEGATAAASFAILLPRNQREREFVIGYECEPRYRTGLLLVGLLGLLFWVLYRQLPAPMSQAHRFWMNYLLAQGYQGDAAFGILRAFGASQLRLGAEREQLLQQLHDPGKANFGPLLQLFNDARVARFNSHQMQWLQLGLERGGHEAAIALAEAEDALTIDLSTLSVNVHGLPVPMGGTPLFYYAWYALRRKEGEGWVSNPPSNRPDLARGAELAALMERFGGHGRAINDLEKGGLKAKTLDQNRSRIKEELVRVLGESLATNYLFEGGRGPDGVLMRYRLALPPERIHVQL